MASTIHPVRAIKAAAYGNPTRVRNALYSIGYDCRRIRHCSINLLVGHLPKAHLELVLRYLMSIRYT